MSRNSGLTIEAKARAETEERMSDRLPATWKRCPGEGCNNDCKRTARLCWNCRYPQSAKVGTRGDYSETLAPGTKDRAVCPRCGNQCSARAQLCRKCDREVIASDPTDRKKVTFISASIITRTADVKSGAAVPLSAPVLVEPNPKRNTEGLTALQVKIIDTIVNRAAEYEGGAAIAAFCGITDKDDLTPVEQLREQISTICRRWVCSPGMIRDTAEKKLFCRQKTVTVKKSDKQEMEV